MSANFFLIEFQSKDKELEKYNGRIALTLGWQPNNDEPFDERWVTITPLLADQRRELVPEYRKNYPYYADGVYENRIWFQNPYPISFETDDMPKFTERIPVPMPRRPWRKAWGGGKERKRYEWIFGRWVHTGWEAKEDEE